MEEIEKEKKLKAAAAMAISTEKYNQDKPSMLECEVREDVTSTSFRPNSIAAASATSVDSSGAVMNLDRIVQLETEAVKEVEEGVGNETKEEDQSQHLPHAYLDLYWLDAAERQCVLN